MVYKASMDSLTKTITVIVTILIAGVIALPFIKRTGHSLPIYTDILLPLVYFIAYAFRPIDYMLTANQLIVRRLFADVKIDRSQIKSVTLADKEQIGRAMRAFGVGGLFGYYGKFTSTKLGSMTWYATRKDKTVLVQTTGNKKIILTPNDPSKFVADFNMQLL